MANATSTQLNQLYIAYFGRPADPTGLSYWTDEGVSVTDFAANMFAQAEFQSAFGDKTIEAQVNQIYINLFARNSDVGGLKYWSTQIRDGEIELAEVGAYLINPEAQSEADKLVFNNKSDAAEAYTDAIGTNTEDIIAYAPASTDPYDGGDALAAGIAFLSQVDGDHAYAEADVEASIGTFDTATNRAAAAAAAELAAAEAAAAEVAAAEAAEVAAAEAAAAEVAAAAAAVEAAAEAAALVPIETVLTTTSAGSSVGNKGPDTWISLDNALTNYNVNGKEGTDTLTATLSGNDSYSVQNVENLVFKIAADSVVDMTDFTGEETVTVQGGEAPTLNNNKAATTYTSKLTADAAFTIDLADTTGTEDSVQLTLDGATSTGNTTIAGIETITVTSTEDSDSLTLVAANATTLNLNGAGDLTLPVPTAALLTTISAADATGDLTVTLPATNLTFTGGSGDDSISMLAASLTNLDTVDGGTGSNDLTLGSAGGVAFATTAASTTLSVSNIQTLTLLADSADDAIDLDLFGDPTQFTTIAITTSLDAADITLTDVQTDSVTIRNTDGGASDIMDDFTYDKKDASGTADTLTLGLTNRDTDGVFTVGSIIAAGIENLTLNTTGGTFGDITVEALTATSLTGATITGDADLTLPAFSATVETLTAGAATGDLSVTFAGEDVTATTGSGDDTIAFGTSLNADDSIDGGAGTDTLTAGDLADGGAVNIDLNITNIERFTYTETVAQDSALTVDFNTDVVERITYTAQVGTNAANAMEDLGAGNIDLFLAGSGAAIDTVSIDRASDSTTDSVDVTLTNTDSATNRFSGTITLNDEETITIDMTGGDTAAPQIVADLDASDATTVTFTNDDAYVAANDFSLTANSIRSGAVIDFSGVSQDIGTAAANINIASADEAGAGTGNVATAAAAMGTDGFTAVNTGSYTIKLGDGRTNANHTTTINLGETNTGADTIEFVNLGSDATNDIGIVVIDNFEEVATSIATNRTVIDFSAFAGIQQLTDLTLTAGELDNDEAVTVIGSEGTDADDFLGTITVLGVAAASFEAGDFTFAS